MEPKHLVLFFQLRVDDSDVETFYVLDSAKGSSMVQVKSRERLWELFYTVPGKEQVLRVIGCPFGRAGFHVDSRGQTKNIFVFC